MWLESSIKARSTREETQKLFTVESMPVFSTRFDLSSPTTTSDLVNYQLQGRYSANASRYERWYAV